MLSQACKSSGLHIYIHIYTFSNPEMQKSFKRNLNIFNIISALFHNSIIIHFHPKTTSSNSLKRCLRVIFLALSWTKNYF